MDKGITFRLFLGVLAMLLSFQSPVLAEGYIRVGSRVIKESSAWWLCVRENPRIAQDQTSGLEIIPASGKLRTALPDFQFLTVGDDSGQIFAFSLGDKFIDSMKAFRVPRWKQPIDLEGIAEIARTGEIAVTLESFDTKVQILKVSESALSLDEEILLKPPKGYMSKSNVGPEGIAFVDEGSYLVVGWEGRSSFPRLRPALSFYKLFLGQDEVKSYKFLKHVQLPKEVKSCSALYYVEKAKTLLILDRNENTLRALTNFPPRHLQTPKFSLDCATVYSMEFAEITDPFGREFFHYSFEGLTVNENGDLFVVTDPWRSYDFSAYRPLNSEPDIYYQLFVPQMFQFQGFLRAFKEEFL